MSVVCSLTTGCVRRNLTIRSEPLGALILMNDQKIGTTPYSYDFQWYGAYRLTLMKDGYNRLDDMVTLRAPWYMWIPVDFVMELLPFPIRDTRAVSYTLQEKQPLPIPVPPEYQQSSPTTTTPEESDGQPR